MRFLTPRQQCQSTEGADVVSVVVGRMCLSGLFYLGQK